MQLVDCGAADTATALTSLAPLSLDDIRQMRDASKKEDQLYQCLFESQRKNNFVVRCGRDRVIKVSTSPKCWYAALAMREAKRLTGLEAIPEFYDVRWYGTLDGQQVWCTLMEHKEGVRVEEAWVEWSDDEKRSFWQQLTGVLGRFRQARGTSITAVGDAACGPQDRMFNFVNKLQHPYRDEPTFLEGVSEALKRRGGLEEGEALAQQLLRGVIKNSTTQAQSTTFPLTHANLDGHILVRPSKDGDGSRIEITGLLSWGESGFYPPWWEAFKSTLDQSSALYEAFTDNDDEIESYHGQIATMRDVFAVIF